MKNPILKKVIFAFTVAVMFSITSCKDNDAREGEMTGQDGIEAEPIGTTATDEAADTTSRAEEDSLIETPSP
jgi:hypothetical protein